MTNKKTVKKVVKKSVKKIAKFDRHAHVECDHKLKFCKHCDTAWTTAGTTGTNQYLCRTQGNGVATVKGLPTGKYPVENSGLSSLSTTNSVSDIPVNHKNH